MDLRTSKVEATTASSAVDITGLTEQCTSWWGKRAVSLPVKRVLEGRAPTTLAPDSKGWPSNHPHTHSFSKPMPYRRGVMCHPLGELPGVVGEALELMRSQKVQWEEKLTVPSTTVIVRLGKVTLWTFPYTDFLLQISHFYVVLSKIAGSNNSWK